MFLSLVFDFCWTFINLLDWGEISPLEGPSLAKWRRFAIVMSFFNILLKIILTFSGWRMNIVYKIKKSNPFKKNTQVKVARAVNKVVRNKEDEKKKRRPVINYENSKEHNIRFVENII